MIEYEKDATPLDYDELQGLLLTHISTRGELDFWEAENIKEAMTWGSKLKKRNSLDPKFICDVHKKMFSNVWSWAGKFRKTDKNIGVPPRLIEVELQTLCDDANAWIEFNTYPPDEFAARFHHKLVFIHPFSNGNGRHSRYMADLILEKIFNVDIFSWGQGTNLAKSGKTRQKYIEALKAADDHDYALLFEFVRS
ncbi:MAG: mobile mystery protein B [Desulfobacterium sp.]|nr:mobile mystery protein B [Desulfobacterium sp.]